MRLINLDIQSLASKLKGKSVTFTFLINFPIKLLEVYNDKKTKHHFEENLIQLSSVTRIFHSILICDPPKGPCTAPEVLQYNRLGSVFEGKFSCPTALTQRPTETEPIWWNTLFTNLWMMMIRWCWQLRRSLPPITGAVGWHKFNLYNIF